MTDIVDRLRSPEFADVAAKYLMWEAAETIRSLRLQVDEMTDAMHVIKDYCPCCGTVFSVRDAGVKRQAIDDAIQVVREYVSDCDCCKDSFESRRLEKIASRLEALKASGEPK